MQQTVILVQLPLRKHEIYLKELNALKEKFHLKKSMTTDFVISIMMKKITLRHFVEFPQITIFDQVLTSSFIAHLNISNHVICYWYYDESDWKHLSIDIIWKLNGRSKETSREYTMKNWLKKYAEDDFHCLNQC